MLKVDAVIIGAGIIGLSVAQEICSPGKDIVVIEQHSGPGKVISSRNSEVIHAGIYYPSGSLKATLCVEGSSMLYAFSRNHGIPARTTGKVIVAVTASEEKTLEELFVSGQANGVQGLALLDRAQLKRIEPHVEGRSALFSPGTGIIDTHALLKRIEALCLENSCSIVYRTRLVAIDHVSSGFVCTVSGPDGKRSSFISEVLINAAGLDSDQIASLAGIDIDEAGYRIYPIKGEYFRIRGSKHRMIQGLVYPCPAKSLTGLGIHVTKDLSGSVRLGPNAFPVKELTYDVDPSHVDEFLAGTAGMLPFLSKDDLIPDMAGIRPKIHAPGEEVRDFVICHEQKRGLQGLINLIGIESPGLTSCLAIGRRVRQLMNQECPI
ncbi:MAG: NAD(P)/FAD-dependent oxidoreductase [Desulfomonilia bacterium]|nr:NAD(P)/FAD-dependent oxidoreductase [Desulfomonilia bacterium]